MHEAYVPLIYIYPQHMYACGHTAAAECVVTHTAGLRCETTQRCGSLLLCLPECYECLQTVCELSLTHC